MFSEGENADTSTCQYYYFVGKFHQFPSVIFLSRSILDALQDALSHSDAVTHSQLAPTSVKTLSSLTTACSTGIFSYVFCTSFSQYFFFPPNHLLCWIPPKLVWFHRAQFCCIGMEGPYTWLSVAWSPTDKFVSSTSERLLCTSLVIYIANSHYLWSQIICE